MKAKITIRNILFLMLSIILLCSLTVMGASAIENDCSCDLGNDGWSAYPEQSCYEQKWCTTHEVWVLRIVDNPDNHTPGLWTEIKPNTCQQTGLEAVLCKDCNEYVFEQRIIPAHDYQVLYGEEATCMKKGYEFQACLKCFDMRTVELPIDSKAHNMSEWQITTVATCVNESGVRTKFCLCVDENGNQCTETITEKYKDAENHVDTDWSEYTDKVAPTCNSLGYLYKTCSGCNRRISKELPRHSESESQLISTVASTCHSKGVEKRKCECGLEFEIELELAPENHEYSDWTVTKEASCTLGELTRTCRYHYTVSQSIPILANGEHSFGEWVTVVEPTCSLTGLEEQKCADCGKVVTRELSTKHDYTKWTEVQKMSCDESDPKNGIKIAECNNCTYEKTFTIPNLHSYGPWFIDKLSTCDKGNTGIKKRICEVCGKTEEEQYVQEHDFTNWYVTTKPVCEADGNSGLEGISTRWCRSCDLYEQKTVPVTHEFEVVDYISMPTCSDSGTVTVECIYCGKTENQIYEAAGHKYGEAEIGKYVDGKWTALAESEITCGMNVVEKRTCIHCLKTTSENKIAGHTYGNWYCEGGFTCGEGAKILTRICSRCNATQTSDNPISLNHPNLKTITTEATCSTSGYTRNVCPDCGYVELVGEITPAYGHKLDASWTTKISATCTTPGSRYKACANCDYIEYQNVARTEHMIIALEAGIEATCTETGLTPKSYCAYCLTVFDSQVIPALGHERAEGSETCKRCGAYEGTNCDCACHSQSGMEKIFFNLICKLYQFFGINQNCKCGALHYEEMGFFAKLLGKG